jgi:tRNA/tmRNA/rRNA uracil-C5-methylase (TrmA/RlmC/RlmD family)
MAFRHRARLAIRGRRGAPKLGLFEAGTHRVVTIPQCSVHHPLINRVAAVVRGALVDAQVDPYSDLAHQGVARYLQVVVERSSQTAQVVLVGNCVSAEPLATCLALIRERLGNALHSLWFNASTGRGNAILGAEFELYCGPASVVEQFGGAAVHYPPGAFGQSNLEVAGLIIDALRQQLPVGARVAEFYAGVGAIGLSLLDRAGEIRLNEVSPQSLQGLEQGIAALDPESRGRLRVIAGTAGESAAAASDVDVVIVDPPRKGLDAALAAQLAGQPPSLLLYVSCDLVSLQRDVATLTAGGGLRLMALTAFNLMPYTDHVETLARFERV